MALAASMVLASCSSETPRTVAELPDGISVSVYQTRSDFAERRLEITVANETSEPFTVTGVDFDSAQFVDPSAWDGDSVTIRTGGAVDLPVALAAPDCAVDDPQASVSIRFLDADGMTGRATLVPTDRFERLPALRAEDCLLEAVDELAEISVHGLPRMVTIGGKLAADLDLSILPTDAAGTLTIGDALGTTLFAQLDPSTGAVVDRRVLDLVIESTTPPTVVELILVPNRCDAHAVAEDKRGAIFPLTVSTGDGMEGTVWVESPSATRQALLDYLAAAC